MKRVESKIQKFQRIIKELEINIKDDDKWPIIFRQLVSGQSAKEQYEDWMSLLEFFLKKEKEVGHCHKGNIYWSIGVIDLIKGDISNAIDYLEKSRDEDIIKLNGEKRITASIGLLSIIKPLLHRYKNSTQSREFDKNLKELYESLNQEEKEKFANLLLEAHNNFLVGKIRIILDNFFAFITEEKARQITKDTYKEVADAILSGVQRTYISQIFAIGSIAEALLDELFQRNDQEIWKIFRANEKIGIKLEKKSKMNGTDYDSSMNLGEKIRILREMTIENICPITKESVLLLSIIGEYRDLIHPRRRLLFEFEASHYVASILLVSVSYIAGDWWPDNIKKMIEANYQFNGHS